MTAPLDMMLQVSLSLIKANDSELMENHLFWTIIAQPTLHVDQHPVLRCIDTERTHAFSGNPNTTIALHHLPILWTMHLFWMMMGQVNGHMVRKGRIGQPGVQR